MSILISILDNPYCMLLFFLYFSCTCPHLITICDITMMKGKKYCSKYLYQDVERRLKEQRYFWHLTCDTFYMLFWLIFWFVTTSRNFIQICFFARCQSLEWVVSVAFCHTGAADKKLVFLFRALREHLHPKPFINMLFLLLVVFNKTFIK